MSQLLCHVEFVNLFCCMDCYTWLGTSGKCLISRALSKRWKIGSL